MVKTHAFKIKENECKNIYKLKVYSKFLIDPAETA